MEQNEKGKIVKINLNFLVSKGHNGVERTHWYLLVGFERMDVAKETLVRLSKCCSELPTRPKATKVRRWMTIGIEGRDGSRYYLEGVKIGGEFWTSVEAFQRFLDKLNEE